MILFKINNKLDVHYLPILYEMDKQIIVEELGTDLDTLEVHIFNKFVSNNPKYNEEDRGILNVEIEYGKYGKSYLNFKGNSKSLSRFDEDYVGKLAFITLEPSRYQLEVPLYTKMNPISFSEAQEHVKVKGLEDLLLHIKRNSFNTYICENSGIPHDTVVNCCPMDYYLASLGLNRVDPVEFERDELNITKFNETLDKYTDKYTYYEGNSIY